MHILMRNGKLTAKQWPRKKNTVHHCKSEYIIASIFHLTIINGVVHIVCFLTAVGQVNVSQLQNTFHIDFLMEFHS